MFGADATAAPQVVLGVVQTERLSPLMLRREVADRWQLRRFDVGGLIAVGSSHRRAADARGRNLKERLVGRVGQALSATFSHHRDLWVQLLSPRQHHIMRVLYASV